MNAQRSHFEGRELPPVAARVDAELVRHSVTIDWLHLLSPRHSDELWEAFASSGFKDIPELEYHPPEFDLCEQRRRLLALPITDIELPALEALLVEKQHELDRQLELVRLRDTAGFRDVSVALFGAPNSELIELAEEILEKTPATLPTVCDAYCEDIVAAARDEEAYYRQIEPDFEARVIVDDDLNSHLMVANGQLHVAASIALPRSQMAGLIAHEVGTHIVTYYNGSRQPLRQLACGLAHYDALQEGLGVLAEHLAGQLPSERLRVIAARVLATQQVFNGAGIAQTYAFLHEEHHLSDHLAFDVALRAARGGGLTKDIVYLRGLHELLSYLRRGGELAPLYRGKFALGQLTTLDALQADGFIIAPRLLPRHCIEGQAQEKVADLCRKPLHQLFQA